MHCWVYLSLQNSWHVSTEVIMYVGYVQMVQTFLPRRSFFIDQHKAQAVRLHNLIVMSGDDLKSNYLKFQLQAVEYRKAVCKIPL